jgi:hypothetical protein
MNTEYPPFGIGILDIVLGIIASIWFGALLILGALLVSVNILILGVLLLGFSRYANGVGVRSIPSWLRYFHMIIGVLIIFFALVPAFLIYFYPFFFGVGWMNLALVAFSCDLLLSGMTSTGVSQVYDWFSFAMGITCLVLASVVQFIPFLMVVLTVGFFIAGIFTCITGVFAVSVNREALSE